MAASIDVLVLHGVEPRSGSGASRDLGENPNRVCHLAGTGWVGQQRETTETTTFLQQMSQIPNDQYVLESMWSVRQTAAGQEWQGWAFARRSVSEDSSATQSLTLSGLAT
jgi:hypothetical protein